MKCRPCFHSRCFDGGDRNGTEWEIKGCISVSVKNVCMYFSPASLTHKLQRTRALWYPVGTVRIKVFKHRNVCQYKSI